MFVKQIFVRFNISILGSFLLLVGCSNNPVGPVTGKPQILVQPQSIAVNFGDTATFQVSATGDPLPSFSWFKNNAAIAGVNDSILKINRAVYTDTGVYYVTVKNSKGEVTSVLVRLDVSGGEPLIGAQSQSKTAGAGDSISLFIQVAGNPPFAYSWYKNDTLITSAHDSVLHVCIANASDLGGFFAVVSNSFGADTSSTIVISANPAKVFIAESDFQSGLLEWTGTDNPTISSSNFSIYQDAVLRSFNGSLYILERSLGSNVMKFDPQKNDASGIIYQQHLGDNYNPQDIAFLSNSKAYIANLDVPAITIINPATGATTGSINISPYTFIPDSNTSPKASALLLVGSDLYVLLQRLNGWNPGAPSLILKINTSTDLVVDTIACINKNGFGMVYSNGSIYVSNPGDGYSIGDGAIEAINLSTKAVTSIISESVLGGNPNALVHKSGTHFYVQNYIGWGNTKVVEIDAAAGTIVDTLPGIVDAFGGICYDNLTNKLYVGERGTGVSGVRVFENNVQVGATLKSSTSLPPSSLAIVR